jgi:L-seryl-tRNA(Ser) seleniumtransferase
MSDVRSRIPGVDALLASREGAALLERYGHARAVEALRDAVSDVRAGIGTAAAAGEMTEGHQDWADRAEDASLYVDRARLRLEAADIPSLRQVINATGVVLHTNLGRAPLADEAVEAMHRAARRYTNLEYDLEGGRRGSRYVHCVSLLCEITGAEDALVVNNAAAALILALNTVGQGLGVAVSRGELVEIGGGFRIPEMLERAGARLVEVGSTNRTRVSDYEAALTRGESGPENSGRRKTDGEASVSAILKVHRSNFRVTGFTEEATLEQLSELARGQGIPLIHDLGSGLMVDASDVGLPPEPRASESLAAGSDVVVVSGDKLLGGTQAGILVGRADLMERMRRNPLCRALRVDKVTLAGLEATLRLYRDPATVRSRVPTLAMLSADLGDLEARACGVAARLREAGVDCEPVATKGAVGGGTYPGVELDSWAVELPGAGADALADALRAGEPPVVGRIVDDRLRLDVRTVFGSQEDDLVRRVLECRGVGSGR